MQSNTSPDLLAPVTSTGLYLPLLYWDSLSPHCQSHNSSRCRGYPRRPIRHGQVLRIASFSKRKLELFQARVSTQVVRYSSLAFTGLLGWLDISDHLSIRFWYRPHFGACVDIPRLIHFTVGNNTHAQEATRKQDGGNPVGVSNCYFKLSESSIPLSLLSTLFAWFSPRVKRRNVKRAASDHEKMTSQSSI